MQAFELLIYFGILFKYIHFVQALKCRNPDVNQQDQDMEWAVRQCLTQMARNATVEQQRRPSNQHSGGLYGSLPGWNRPNRDVNRQRDNGDENPYRSEQGNPFQQDRRIPPWDSSRHPSNRQNMNRPNFEQEGDVTYFDEDRRQRGPNKNPHTSGQKAQHDRDIRNNNNNNYYNNNKRKPLFHENNNYKPYFPNNYNNFGQEKPNWQESRLSNIDSCIIYCIFQELKMVDDWGRVSKHAVMDRMTANIRDQEMMQFIRFTVEECFNSVDMEDIPSRYGQSQDNMESCRTAKEMAMCLEERGRQTCEDWDDNRGINGDQTNKDDNNQFILNNNNNNNQFPSSSSNNNNNNQFPASNNNNNNSRDKEKAKEVKKGLTLNNNRG